MKVIKWGLELRNWLPNIGIQLLLTTRLNTLFSALEMAVDTGPRLRPCRRMIPIVIGTGFECGP